MFTGLITGTCTVKSCNTHASGMDVTLSYDIGARNTDTSLHPVSIGDSVSLNGVCSTIVSFTNDSFNVQFLKETLQKSTFSTLKTGDMLNVEWCATPKTALGGHIVSGHVDDVGTIKEWSWGEEWGRLTVTFDKEWASHVVYKGSITIDGMSLTVAELGDDWLTCCIIPHTKALTVLDTKKTGDNVNLEFDMIGKYVNRFFQAQLGLEGDDLAQALHANGLMGADGNLKNKKWLNILGKAGYIDGK